MRLILIRHAEPQIDPAVPASGWPISPRGRASAVDLARRLEPAGIRRLVSSIEPKCTGTAEEIAAVWDIDWSTAPDLHEHERGVLEWLGQDRWHALLRRFFDNPNQLIFGMETANQALERFAGAVDAVVREQGLTTDTVALVSHGTVISLFAARIMGVDPYSIWKDLAMPDYVELMLDEMPYE